MREEQTICSEIINIRIIKLEKKRLSRVLDCSVDESFSFFEICYSLIEIKEFSFFRKGLKETTTI